MKNFKSLKFYKPQLIFLYYDIFAISRDFNGISSFDSGWTKALHELMQQWGNYKNWAIFGSLRVIFIKKKNNALNASALPQLRTLFRTKNKTTTPETIKKETTISWQKVWRNFCGKQFKFIVDFLCCCNCFAFVVIGSGFPYFAHRWINAYTACWVSCVAYWA